MVQTVRAYYRALAPLLDPSLQRRGDEAFWRDIAERGFRSVLELGCGTGRITDPLADGAGRVVGLDISRPLLRRARAHLAARSNVSLVAGDMRRVPLRERFDLVAAANDPFAHLLSDRDRDRALGEVAGRLAPGGRFVLDALWLTPETLRAAASPRGRTVERDSRGAGRGLRVTERWRCDPATLRCTVRYRYESGDGEVTEAACRVRPWTLPEARDRLRAAGLALRAAWGEYDATPWEAERASVLVLEAEAPSARAGSRGTRTSRREDEMATRLAEKECVPCKGGVPPLEGEELRELQEELDRGWEVVDEHHLRKTFEFDDFRGALDFTNEVGELAEEQGHHPDLYLTWGEVEVKIWTHKIDGLTESDFVLAAKVEELR